MKYNFNEFAKEFGMPIFNYGLGFFLMVAEVGSAAGWFRILLTSFIVLFGVLAFIQFAAIAHFWKLALENKERFGPKGDLYERGQSMLDNTCLAVVSCRYKETFWFSVAASMVLLAGLIRHELWIAFAVEATACVIVYSVTRAFLTHFHVYYALVEGKELENG